MPFESAPNVEIVPKFSTVTFPPVPPPPSAKPPTETEPANSDPRGQADRKTAVASASADRLCQNTVRLIARCKDVVVARNAHRSGRAAACAEAADRDAAASALQGRAGRSREAAIAAAAADRLGQNAVRLCAAGFQGNGSGRNSRAIGAETIDRDRIRCSAATAAAADRDADSGRADRKCAGDRKAAVAAATARSIGPRCRRN